MQYISVLIIICLLVIIFSLGGCKRNYCEIAILEYAPTYVELRTTYEILKPKVIKLRKNGQIDDDTWKVLMKLDKKLVKVDSDLKKIYQKAILSHGRLTEKETLLLIQTIRDLIQFITLSVPKII